MRRIAEVSWAHTPCAVLYLAAGGARYTVMMLVQRTWGSFLELAGTRGSLARVVDA